ncbi:MAG TPA: hypothetical protein VF620_14410 [Allosphingosinicella sp.]|jgi:hypothetical protein
MSENEGGPGIDQGDVPERIQDGGDPAAKGGEPSPGDGGETTGGGDQGAIDLDAVRDRAS